MAGLAKLHSYGSVRERLWDVGDRTSLVVFDEAHQAVAATYKDVVETIVTRRPRTGLLGLSATPGRTWGDPDTDAAVAELFHGNKVTLDFEGENPIRRLIRDGYLAEVEFSLLNVEPGLQPSLDDLAEVSESLDIPERLAESLGDDEQRNLRILQRLVDLGERHQRVLVFAASVRNAGLLAGVCRALGIAADAVVGTTEAVERERMIARFKRPGGPVRVLVNLRGTHRRVRCSGRQCGAHRPSYQVPCPLQPDGRKSDPRTQGGRDAYLRSGYCRRHNTARLR